MSGEGPDERYPVLDDLGRQFHAAAGERAARARAKTKRRRRRRTGGLAAIAVLGAAGAAGAAQLIGIGEPVDDRRDVAPALRPAPGSARPLSVTVADRDGGPSWAVGTYAGTDGRACAIAGRTRAGLLGEQTTTGVFRPYPRTFTGTCGTLRDTTLVYNVLRPRDVAVRTLVFGRAGRDVQRVAVTAEGRRTLITPARSGAFLLVYDGVLTSRDLAVRPR